VHEQIVHRLDVFREQAHWGRSFAFFVMRVMGMREAVSVSMSGQQASEAVSSDTATDRHKNVRVTLFRHMPSEGNTDRPTRLLSQELGR
jgi:hypothetical protein